MTLPKIHLHPPHPKADDPKPPNRIADLSTQDMIHLAALINARPDIKTTKLVPFFLHLSPTKSENTVRQALQKARRKLEAEGHGLLDELDPHGVAIALQPGSLRGDIGRLREIVTVKALQKASYAAIGRELTRLLSLKDGNAIDLKEISSIYRELSRRITTIEEQEAKQGKQQGKTSKMDGAGLASLIDDLEREREAKKEGKLVPGIS